MFYRISHCNRKVSHVNLLSIIASCSMAPDICYLTDYAAQGSLHNFLHNPDIEMTPAHAIKLAFDTVKGLLYLHELKPYISHGNLKSQNILVRYN